jgi:uncharacterized membrane protein
MRKRNRDLGFFLLLACGNLIYALLPIRFLVWQCIIAGALVFFVPGYLLQEILVQKQMYDMIWRLLVSVGLSLSIDIMSGFLLNVLPEGLTGRTWGLWLSGLTIVGVVERGYGGEIIHHVLLSLWVSLLYVWSSAFLSRQPI